MQWGVGISLSAFSMAVKHGRVWLWELRQVAKQSDMLMEPQPAEWKEFGRNGPEDREAAKGQRVQSVCGQAPRGVNKDTRAGHSQPAHVALLGVEAYSK